MVTYSAGVSRIISFGDEVPQVPDAFVEALQQEVTRLETGDEEIVVDWKVEVGEEVEIADGPFKGMEGQVLEVRPEAERVRLLLEFLGESKPVEVSLFSLILSHPEIPTAWKGSR